MIWVMLGLAVLIFLLVRIVENRKRDLEDQDAAAELSFGNVSVFMDRSGNIDIIPFSMDRLHRGRASDYPLRLQVPVAPFHLGETIRKGLVLSAGEKNLSSEDLMKHLGFYTWKEYSKGKKSVSVTCREEGVVLNSTIRRSDGAYVFRMRGYEKILPVRLTSSTLGEAILERMKASG